jgi:hypothetical protein
VFLLQLFFRSPKLISRSEAQECLFDFFAPLNQRTSTLFANFALDLFTVLNWSIVALSFNIHLVSPKSTPASCLFRPITADKIALIPANFDRFVIGFVTDLCFSLRAIAKKSQSSLKTPGFK